MEELNLIAITICLVSMIINRKNISVVILNTFVIVANGILFFLEAL